MFYNSPVWLKDHEIINVNLVSQEKKTTVNQSSPSHDWTQIPQKINYAAALLYLTLHKKGEGVTQTTVLRNTQRDAATSWRFPSRVESTEVCNRVRNQARPESVTSGDKNNPFNAADRIIPTEDTNFNPSVTD